MPETFPTVGLQSLEMSLKRTVAVTQSPFTYESQTFQHNGAIWQANITLQPRNQTESRVIEAFIAKLKGREGTFYFGNPMMTSSLSANTVSSAAIRAESFTLGSGTDAVPAGTQFQLNNYLYITTEDKAASATTLNFQPGLRVAVSSSQTITYNLPKSTWRLVSNDVSYSINQSSLYSFSFACEEAL
jgi:hypothetical protein